MEWFIILVLGAIAAWQGAQLGELNRRVGELERRLAARVAESLWTPPAPVGAAPEPAPAPAPPPAQPEEEALVLDQPLPPDDREPLLLDTPIADDELLLDTPLPTPSNDTELPPAPPVAPPRAEPERIAQALRATAPPKPAFRFDQWLAEKGLAWLGGGAAALGAIFLVSVAAQQRWFTPQVQLVLALVLGAILLGASEWARRFSLSRALGHPLVAALLAGAGVVAFYATAWAAHGLYNFIDYRTAAALLALCAIILIGLSFLHGQALGVLAIIAALLAPSLTHEPLWLSAALTLYVIAAGAAGFALATFRRWAWVALSTLIGLYFWFWAAWDVDEIRRALALLSFASFGCVALALRPPLPDDSKATISWSNVHALGPTIGIVVSSVFLIFVWPAFAPPMSGRIAGPALISVFHVALAAYAVRGHVAMPLGLITAIGGLVGGCVAYLVTRSGLGPVGADFYPVILTAALATVICAVGARPHRRWRIGTAAAGALGAAILVVLTAFSRDDVNAVDAWAPLFGAALPLLAAAWRATRDGASPTTERVIDFWAGAAAVLILLGIEFAFPADALAAAFAGAALMFASGFAWRGWRVLRWAALAAAVLTLGHALSPDLIGATLTGDIPLWGALVILASAAALLSGAAYFAAAEPRSPYAEALSAASVMTILIGGFLALRWFATGSGAPLDPFGESALRVVALMAAGHVMMARPGQVLGLIGRWRGHVLLGLGLLYTLLVPVLGINPWWGVPPAPVSGPLLLDSLTLAFAAPAAILLAAARRLYLHQRTLARIYAIAGGVLALVWAVLEVRRFAHGGDMAVAPVGLLEGAAYALLFLGAALGVAIFARMRAAKHADGPFTQDLLRSMRVVAWAGLIAAALILLIARHPWWGAQSGAATDALETGFAVLAQAVAVGLSLALGRALSLAREPEPTRFAAASAALVLTWSFGHAAIRWLYHQGAMDDGASFIGLEGFANALWPLIFVLAGSELTLRAPGRDTVRAYLHDLEALWSSAVWPALGFAALGLWLLWNPWWGANPAPIVAPVSAAAAFFSLLIAAWLSMTATRVPRVRWAALLERAATVICIVHLWVAATLAVRWLYHGEALSDAPVRDVELWSYSATSALFGAVAFWLGLSRNKETVRWSGLTILLLTTLYVYVLIFTQLTGFIRAGTAIGLAVVLFGVAWIARTYRPGPRPDDLVNVTPSARRERRYGRRQRSQ